MALIIVLLTLLTLMHLSAPAAAASSDVVISQVYGGGGNSGATYRNDYVELFNRGTAQVDIAGWSLQYTSSTGNSWGSNKLALSGKILPGRYFLVQLAAGSNTGLPALPTPDMSGSINMSATTGKIALVRSTTSLPSVNCPSGGDLVDLVGYGTADCGEGGTKAPGLSNSAADFRAANGCQDTDNNAADFAIGTPTPRNSSSAANPCSTPPVGSGAASPATVPAGSGTLLTVSVTPGGSPASTGLTVTADLTAIGGTSGTSFYDDGTHGDATAGDGRFSYQATVSAATASGDKSLPFTVSDAQGRSTTGSIVLSVQTAPMTDMTATLQAPMSVISGDAAVIAVAIVPGQNPTSSSITVVGDLSALGGSASQPLYDDGNNGDVTAGDNIFGTQITVTAAPGVAPFTMTASDAQGRHVTLSSSLSVTAPPVATTKLLISELLVSPSTSQQPEEYLRIYNPGNAAVDLAGWSISTVTGSTGVIARATFLAGATVGAGQSVVVAKDGAMFRQQVDPYAQSGATFEYGPTNSGFGTRMSVSTTFTPALSDTAANAILRDPAGAEVDVVRYVTCNTSGGQFVCNNPVAYSGVGWSGAVIQWPQTQGFSFKNKLLARAIDESTITATSAGSYLPDTNTAADWLTGATNSSNGANYWQAPNSQSATPLSTRDFNVGQMQSLPMPTWQFNGTVTAFVAPDNAYETIAALFDGATTSIDLNMYDFQLVDMAQVLVNARQRGVAIRVLIEGQPCCDFRLGDQQKYVAKLLSDAGIQVRFVGSDAAANRFRRYSNVNHAKYAVVDGNKAMLFSGNFKKSSTSRNPAGGNRDWGVIIHSAEAAAYYQLIFDWDYDPNRRDSLPFGYSASYGAPTTGFVPDLSTTTDPDATYAHPFSAHTVTGTFKVTPVMVPETAFLSNQAILGMVKHAQRELLLEWATLDPYWGSSISNASAQNTPTPLVAELLNAARRGVRVRVILDGKYDVSGDPKSNTATVAYLNQQAQAEGLDLIAKIMKFTVIQGNPDSADYLVREYPGYNEIHNKGIIVDGTQSLISSINGTQASWLRNREAAVIVENAEIGRYFGDAFWYDWYDGGAPLGPVISELQYDPPGIDEQNEWIELYNPTAGDINLTGWSLQNKNGEWSLPAGTIIKAGGTLTIARTDDGFRSLTGFYPDITGLSLQLVNTGDTLTLIRNDSTEADRVSWLGYSADWDIASGTGQSLIRSNACKDTNSRLDWAGATPQPGTATCNGNTPPPPAPAPVLLLSEVQYDSLSTANPEPDEYIEILNEGGSAADLSGYQLLDNNSAFKLPAGTTLAAGAYLVITRDGASFAARYGRQADLTGMTLQLGNAGDQVILQDAKGHTLDTVAWEGYLAGWDLLAGPGWSLNRTGNSKSAADWVVGDPTPGTAITAADPDITATLSPATPDGQNGWYLSTLTVTGTTNSWGAVTVEISPDGTIWNTVAQRNTAANLTALPLTGKIDVASDVESATYQLRVTDVLGRQRLIATPALKKDGTAPVILISGVTEGAAADGSATISYTATDNLTTIPLIHAALNGQDFASGTTLTVRGSYTLVVSASDEAGNRSEQQVHFTLYHTPTLAVDSASASYGQPIALTATLTDNGEPVVGARLSFAVNGSAAGVAMTDQSGHAQVTYTANLPAGAYPIAVRLNQDDALFLRAAAGSGALQINPAALTATYMGATLVKRPDNVALRASLTPALPGIPTRFTLTDAITGGASTFVAISDANGSAAVTVPLPVGVYSVAISSDDRTRFIIDAPPAELVVYEIGTGSVTGGGWVMAGADKVEFSLQARYLKGAADGHAEVNNLAGLHLNVKQLDWLVITGNTAILQGRADGYSLRLTAVNGQPAQVALRLVDASGRVVGGVQQTGLSGGELKVR